MTKHELSHKRRLVGIELRQRGTMTNEELDQTITKRQLIGIIGFISAELASPVNADAWNGNAPDWFPEPPEWLDLLERAVEAVEREPEAFEVRIPSQKPETPGISAEDFLDQYPQVSASPAPDPDSIDHDCGCGG